MNQTKINDLYGTPKVGADTLTYCSRCKLELAHVIMSMIDGVPAKVICKTCKSEHKYKRTATSKSTTRSSSPRTPRVTVKNSDYWEKMVQEHPTGFSKKYSFQDTFSKGELVEHPKFGLGLVEEVQSGNKIKVLFRDEERVLIHAKA